MRISACLGGMMKDLVKATKALSDETRLRILSLLIEKDCCVCEVMQAMEISQTRASRNLGILYNAGFLRLTKDGIWSVYALDRDGMGLALLDLVNAVGRGMAESPQARLDKARLKRSRRVGVAWVKSSA